MNLKALPRMGRPLLIILALGAWAGLAHYGSAGHGNPDLSAALGVAPLILAAALLWPGRSPGGMLFAATLALGLVGLLWPRLRESVPLLYYIQHLGAHLALGVFFGRTLRAGSTPLITQLARAMSATELSPRKLQYTRRVTQVWTGYFLINALVSTLLFLFASREIWSFHANILSWPLIASLFLGEHLFRRRILPPEERPGVAEVIQAYLRISRTQRNPTSSAPP